MMRDVELVAANLVRRICNDAKSRGVPISMHKGWDLVARMLYGKSYSQAIAAERAGVLHPPFLFGARIERLRDAEYGRYIDALAFIATEEYEIASDFGEG